MEAVDVKHSLLTWPQGPANIPNENSQFQFRNSGQFFFIFMCHLDSNMAATSNVRQGARLLAQAVFPLFLLPSHVVADEELAARP